MTRLPNVRKAVQALPWAILPEKLAAILEVLEVRAAGGAFTDDQIAARIEAGSRDARPAPAGGIAVLPVFGAIMPRANLFSEISGGADAETLGRQLDALLADDAVKAIVLDLDSPGGQVQGIPELGAKILAGRDRKAIVAQVNHLCASAAYWLASCCSEIAITPSGNAGSIGVLMVHEDTSEADAQAGIRYEVLSAGKYKADAAGIGPLSDDARTSIQTMLDEYYTAFVDAVAKGRGVNASDVRGGFGEGRLLTASQAKGAGMVDRIATMDETLARLGARGGVARAQNARAERPPELIAASLREADTILANYATTEVLAAQFAAILAASRAVIPSVAVGAATPSVVPVPASAPVAKEQQMSADAAAAQAAQEKDRALAAAEKSLVRMKEFTALIDEYPEYFATIRKVQGDESKGVADAMKAILGEQQAKLNGTPVIVGAGGRVGTPREAEKKFASFGEQVFAICQAGMPGGRVDPRLRLINEHALKISAGPSGMSEGIGADGGYFIAPELLPGVFEPVYAEDPILSRVTRIPIGSNTNGAKYNVVDEVNRGNGTRWGGISMAWGGEADTAAAAKAKLRQLVHDLKKLIGVAYLTDELMQDTTMAEALLTKAFQAEATFMLTDAIFRGTGAGQPLGWLNSGCKVTQAIEGTQTIANSATFLGLNVSKMMSLVPSGLWNDIVFLYQQELLPYIVNATAGSSGVVPLFIGAGGLTNKPFDTILGRPAFPSEFCEAVGTPGDLIAVVPSQYHLADKGGPTQAQSVHVRFIYDETALRITLRADGQPLWLKSVTPFKGANARSPFVVLNTRS
ncbi:MAG TPA: phage major capsid protein [Gemmatimonadales bacterium]|nr:phage major capsid protein [Gemmatimonadales bacterium]